MRPGETIAGRYELIRLARGGASGMVFEAEDRSAGGRVALKLIHTHKGDEAFRARVEREIDILRSLNHPNVVRYLDSGVVENTLIYLALEWLAGEDLADYSGRRTLSLGAALAVTRQISSGLGAAHALGIIHRDVKPANVFLVNSGADLPEVRVLDFGVAKQSQAAGVTQAGAILGTPSYMAPEQAHHARRVDGRADVFSLGVVLFEMVAGRLPWASHSELARLARILVEPALPLEEVCPNVPLRVAELVKGMLAIDAEARISTMAEVEAQIAACLSHLGQELLAKVYAPTVSLSEIEAFGRVDTKSVAAPEIDFSPGEVTPIFDSKSAKTDPIGSPPPDSPMEEGNSLSHVQLHGRGALVGRDPVLERLRNEVVRALTLRQPTSVLVVGIAGAGKTRIRTELQRRLKELPQKPTVLAGRAEEPVRAAPYRFLRRLLLLDARVFPDDPLEERRRKLSRLVPASEIVGRAMRKATRVKDTPKPRSASSAGAATHRARSDWQHRPSVVAILADAFDLSEKTEVAPDLDRQVALSLLGSALDIPFPSPVPLESIHADPLMFSSELERTLDLVISERARSEPLILLVDDAHLLDRKSAELLAGLVADGRKGRIAVISFAQPTIQSADEPASVLAEVSQVTINLPALETDDAASLIRALAEGPVDPAALQVIIPKAGGSPLHLEQVTRAVMESKVFERRRDGVFCFNATTDSAAMELVPPTAAAAVRTRLRQLDQRLQKTLVSAAIFGEVFWAEGVAALTDQSLERTTEQLDALLLADFVRQRPSPRYRDVAELEFAHSVVRRVVLSKIRPGTRQGLERRAAQWLEARGEADAATLAGHHLRAADFESGARLLLEAARHCLSLGAFDDALFLAEEALDAIAELGLQDELRGDLLEISAEAAAHLGRDAEADVALGRLLELPVSDLRRASALLSRARSAVRAESYAQAQSHATAALEVLARLEAPLERSEAELVRARSDEAMVASRDALRGYLAVKGRAETLGARALLGRAVRGLGRIGLASGDPRSAEARFTEAAEHARAARDVGGVFESTLGLAEVKLRTGELEEARQLLDSADKLSRTTAQDGRARVRRASLLADEGAFEDARLLLDEVRAAALNPGLVSLSLLHRIYLHVGDAEGSLPVELIETVRETHHRLSSEHRALALPMEMGLALLLGAQGASAEAKSTMESARLRFAREGALAEIEAARFLLARFYVLEGLGARPEEQMSALREVVEQLDLVGSRLERKMRSTFLDRSLCRAVLALAAKRGLLVSRDDLSGRLGM